MGDFAAVILAAGLSTRFKSATSKVLHSLAGRPIVSYPIALAKACGARKSLVVRGPGQEDLARYLRDHNVAQIVQRRPLGTADAVGAVSRALASFSGHVLVLYGDVPLIRPEVLSAFLREMGRSRAVCGLISMSLADPAAYGRVVRDPDGRPLRVVEARDASAEERRICEVNSGIFCADRAWLFRSLRGVGCENAKGEFYLTDLVRTAVREGQRVVAWRAPSSEDFLGINTRVELALAARVLRARINRRHMLDGVGIADELHTSIDADVRIGRDTSIWPFSFLLGKTRVGSGCIIENGVLLRDAVVEDGACIKSQSVVEEGRIGAGAVVGPFARIRPGSRVGRAARVGNFVELKKCELKEGAKANHLTYLGDATVGARANIGCGTITCNYDGSEKHRTIIGEEAFVGSDVQFVAPVRVGRGAVIGAGSTITKDVPADALALARAEQRVVKGWAAARRAGQSKRGRKGRRR